MFGIEYGLGRFGDRRLKKGGAICMQRWWRGRAPVSAGSLAQRAQEVRFTRFLRNQAVTANEMAARGGEHSGPVADR